MMIVLIARNTTTRPASACPARNSENTIAKLVRKTINIVVEKCPSHRSNAGWAAGVAAGVGHLCMGFVRRKCAGIKGAL